MTKPKAKIICPRCDHLHRWELKQKVKGRCILRTCKCPIRFQPLDQDGDYFEIGILKA